MGCYFTTESGGIGKIERKHLTLRTRIKRLARKTICFSKTTQMHDVVLGLFVNRYAFGRAVSTWSSPLLKHYWAMVDVCGCIVAHGPVPLCTVSSFGYCDLGISTGGW